MHITMTTATIRFFFFFFLCFLFLPCLSVQAVFRSDWKKKHRIMFTLAALLKNLKEAEAVRAGLFFSREKKKKGDVIPVIHKRRQRRNS